MSLEISSNSTASMVRKLPRKEFVMGRGPKYTSPASWPKQGSRQITKIDPIQLRTPLQTLAASMDLSGFSFLALSRRTSVVSG